MSVKHIEATDVAPRDRVSIRTKFGYAIGDFGANLAFQVTSFYLLFFFTDVFGILPALAGTIILVSKIWDAISDPLMGFVTDRTNSRWGKKRPYLLFGAIPLGAAVFLLFLGPDISDNLKFLYGMVTFILFCTTITVVNVPYLALTPSLTRDSNERAVVTGYRVIFGILGTLVAAGATLSLGGLIDAEDQSNAFRYIGLIYGVIVAIVTLISFATVKEKVSVVAAKREPLKKMLKSVLKNKPFLIITFGTALHVVAMSTLAVIISYYFKYNLNNESMTTVGFLFVFVTAAVFIPVFVKISKRTSKKFAYNLGMGIVAVGLALIFFFGNHTLSVFGINIPLIYVFLFFSGAGLSTNWLSPWSILPDTVEYSEWKTSIRNEGMLYGIFYFVFKLGSALAGFLVGNILAMAGYVANAAQTPNALLAIKILFTWMPIAFIVGGILFVRAFPITAQMHRKIRKEISQIDREKRG